MTGRRPDRTETCKSRKPLYLTPIRDSTLSSILAYTRVYCTLLTVCSAGTCMLVGNFIDDFRVKRVAKPGGPDPALDAPEEQAVEQEEEDPWQSGILQRRSLQAVPPPKGETDTPGAGAKWSTMPQYFKEKGYQVYGTGESAWLTVEERPELSLI